ncbi:SRP40, C-terminal domain-containing protein [Cryomyces antarcticus]
MANDRKHGGRNGRSRPWGSQSSRQTGANSMSIPASKMRTFGSSASTSSEAEAKGPENVQQPATQKAHSSTVEPTKQPIKYPKQSIEHATAPAPFLELVSNFLQEYGYEESARSLRVEIRKRGPSKHSKTALSNGTVAAMPSLLKVYEAAQTISAPVKDAQKTGKTAKKDSTAGAKKSAASSSSSDEDSDDEASDSDSDSDTGMSDAGSDSSASSSSISGSSSSSSAAPAAMKNSAQTAVKSLKRKASSSGSASSSASESSSSSSDSDSAIVPEPVLKKTKKDAKETKAAKLKRSKSSSESTSESESDSTSSSGSSISTADISLPSSTSDSSSSDSPSSSDSDSEDRDAKPSSTPKQKKKKKKTVENGVNLEGRVTSTEAEPIQSQRKSSDSSATLEAPPTPIEDGSESNPPAHTSAKRKRSASPEEGTAVLASGGNAKRVKKENVPFSRIPADTKVDPKFASNAYVPYDYAERAHRDLVVTKGKGFTKEKNKKKRGAYRGGMIDMAPKGIKFED